MESQPCTCEQDVSWLLFEHLPCSVVGMAAIGMNLFPSKVTFSNIGGKYYVDIL